MDNLPTELILQILHQLPPSSLSNIRLISRHLEFLAFPLLFSHVPQWLDLKQSHQKVLAIAHDAYNRPAVMWSPWGMGPDGEVEDIWRGICWRVLAKGGFGEGNVLGGDDDGKEMRDWEELEINEQRLRTGQNRYLLYKAFLNGDFKCRRDEKAEFKTK